MDLAKSDPSGSTLSMVRIAFSILSGIHAEQKEAFQHHDDFANAF